MNSTAPPYSTLAMRLARQAPTARGPSRATNRGAPVSNAASIPRWTCVRPAAGPCSWSWAASISTSTAVSALWANRTSNMGSTPYTGKRVRYGLQRSPPRNARCSSPTDSSPPGAKGTQRAKTHSRNVTRRRRRMTRQQRRYAAAPNSRTMIAACLITCLVVMTPEIIGSSRRSLRTRGGDRVRERLLHLARERERSRRRGAGQGARHRVARHRAVEGAFSRQFEVHAAARHAHALEGQGAVADVEPARPPGARLRQIQGDGNLQAVPQHEALPPLRNGAAGLRPRADAGVARCQSHQSEQHRFRHGDLLWRCSAPRASGPSSGASYSGGNKRAALAVSSPCRPHQPRR